MLTQFKNGRSLSHSKIQFVKLWHIWIHSNTGLFYHMPWDLFLPGWASRRNRPRWSTMCCSLTLRLDGKCPWASRPPPPMDLKPPSLWQTLCSDAANKAKALISLVKSSFQNHFIIYRALGHSHLEHGVQACSPNFVAVIWSRLVTRLVICPPKRLGRGSAFSVRVVEYWTKLLVKISTESFSRKGWSEFEQRYFPTSLYKTTVL